MTKREAFIEAIAANPADDTVRLAFADWRSPTGCRKTAKVTACYTN